MPISVAGVIPLSRARASLSELADQVKDGVEKVKGFFAVFPSALGKWSGRCRRQRQTIKPLGPRFPDKTLLGSPLRLH
jgi:hypothetical protein